MNEEPRMAGDWWEVGGGNFPNFRPGMDYFPAENGCVRVPTVPAVPIISTPADTLLKSIDAPLDEHR